MIILITGASGSGTTTLGRALAERYKFTHLDTDDYYWLPVDPPFSLKRAPEERLILLLKEVRRIRHVVISGSIMNWGSEVEDAPDLIVYLDLDTAIRVVRLIKREQDRFGAVDPAFIEWASLYGEGTAEGRSREKHAEWLAIRSCPVLKIEGDLTVDERVSQIAPHVAALQQKRNPNGFKPEARR